MSIQVQVVYLGNGPKEYSEGTWGGETAEGKEANEKGVMKRVTSPPGELGRPYRTCPSIVPLRGGGAGAFIHQLLIGCCWLRPAPGHMSSPTFLSGSPPRSSVLLCPEKAFRQSHKCLP